MKQNKRRILLALVVLLFAELSNAQQNTSIYVNDMDYVLGDVKQAFIKDKINNEAQIDNLLIGFKALNVNGIRIPIIAEGHYPNKPMLKLFVEKATANGFLIFANPAQSSGGKRLANGVISEEDPLFESVLNKPEKTQALIDAVKSFAQEFPCKWINPFNEDSKPGNSWSVNQINTIYASLKDQLNGAELIGPCVWGIASSIEVLEQTRIRDYISVSTTHNLGFEHNKWPRFIELSYAKNLPVWDSEVNNYEKDGNKARIVAAIENDVDGLVLYDSWDGINLGNGTINANLQTIRDIILKNTTAIEDKGSTSLKIYPNPALSDAPIMIRGVEQSDVITVYDLQGNVVYSAIYEGDYHIIKAGSLPKGVFLVNVGQNKTRNRKNDNNKIVIYQV